MKPKFLPENAARLSSGGAGLGPAGSIGPLFPICQKHRRTSSQLSGSSAGTATQPDPMVYRCLTELFPFLPLHVCSNVTLVVVTGGEGESSLILCHSDSDTTRHNWGAAGNYKTIKMASAIQVTYQRKTSFVHSKFRDV